MKLEQYIEDYFIEHNIPLINKYSKKSTVELATYGRIKAGWSAGSQNTFIKKYFKDKPKFVQLKTYIPSLNNDKFCCECNEVKSNIEFTNNISTIDGKTHLCKDCDSNRYKNYYKDNKDYKLSKNKEHYTNNKKLYLAKSAARRAAKLKRTPKWANLQKIKEFYLNCPEGHHVDHIIPLQGKNISGFHVLENLQYLPAKENLSKSNKWPPN